MSYKLKMETFPTAGVSKLLATNGGAHIFNVTLSTDAWNGAFIKKGEMVSFDNYAEAAASEIKAKVVWKAANGNFYVEILEDTDVLFVYNTPIIETAATKGMGSEKYFYIAAGDVARAHQLKAGDIVELSADGFSGDVKVGASITTITGKKPVIAGA